MYFPKVVKMRDSLRKDSEKDVKKCPYIVKEKL